MDTEGKLYDLEVQSQISSIMVKDDKKIASDE